MKSKADRKKREEEAEAAAAAAAAAATAAEPVKPTKVSPTGPVIIIGAGPAGRSSALCVIVYASNHFAPICFICRNHAL
jgi:D-arabinose 1-dehydrogenase-like Zn-dependent alcohol dehydrogenase